MFVFKHPKYYKELRKRNKSDQVISSKNRDGECERAPGQGLKPQAPSTKQQAIEESVPYTDVIEASSVKLQAPSVKLSNQPEQASSDPEQASSDKRQAPSSKRQA